MMKIRFLTKIVPAFILVLTILQSCSSFKKITIYSAKKSIKEVYFIDRSDNKRNGKYAYYFDDNKLMEGEYTNDKRSGKWHFFDILGGVSFSGEYVKDTMNGCWAYYKNSQLISMVYFDHGKPDSAFGYSENGTLIYELKYDQQRKGVCKKYYKSGKLREIIALSHNLMDGEYFIYCENGTLHRKLEYSNSKIISTSDVFNYLGEKIDSSGIKDGRGTLRLFYLSDAKEMQVLEDTKYENGQKNGWSSRYFKNGKIQSKGKYENGNRVDRWMYYKEDGEINFYANYEKGQGNEAERENYYRLFNYSLQNEESDYNAPMFQGGENKRVEFIVNSIKYPQDCVQKAISGMVIIEFVTGITGELEYYQIIKSVHPSLDAEVIRLLKLMPRWSPLFYGGAPARVFYQMPIKFSLE